MLATARGKVNPELEIELRSLQCVRVPKIFKKGQDPVFCLLLLHDTDQRHAIYFTSVEAQRYWHKAIMTLQGFWDEPKKQY